MVLVTAAWSVFLELSPWLLLGAVAAALLYRVLPRNFAARALRGRASVLRAVGLGLPLPLCSCGVLPTALGLRRAGAGRGASIGFLISTPQTGVDSMLVSASFLGWPFALAKVAVAGLTGVVGGWIADAVSPDTGSPEADAGDASRPGWKAALAHGMEVLRLVLPWVMVGVAVSALLDVLVPTAAWTAMSSYGVWIPMLAALALSLPLYVCATGSVPIAATLVANGFPVGAALVFLMAGPATNLGTLGAVWRNLGPRSTAAYLGVIVAGSLGFGWLVSGILPVDVSPPSMHEHAGPVSYASAAIVGAFALEAAYYWVRDKMAWFTRSEAPEVRLAVGGMSCGGCARKVQNALLGQTGVEAATVDHASGVAVVRTRHTGGLAEAVEEAGFTARILDNMGPSAST